MQRSSYFRTFDFDHLLKGVEVIMTEEHDTDVVMSRACYHNGDNGGDIYDFQELDLLGTRNISLSEYKGKVVMIVNVATY
ncbi:hypothetical protein E2C01_080793 [Portunus trituberculatus]|uniref:Glutathione peroxidase n=1 Tax=Portunus trituberculatus TaxID=210409 RepID=A0A5B7J0J4_PORTR|nr:hypothetical protein [Portunus trituberculatus]